jgi:hypothetical protein
MAYPASRARKFTIARKDVAALESPVTEAGSIDANENKVDRW